MSFQLWGVRDLGTLAGTFAIPPGFGSEVGSSLEFRWAGAGFIYQMIVRQNSLPGGANVDYVLRVNGVDAIVVAGVSGSVSDAVAGGEVEISDGDLVEVVVVKPALVSGIRDVIISLVFMRE